MSFLMRGCGNNILNEEPLKYNPRLSTNNMIVYITKLDLLKSGNIDNTVKMSFVKQQNLLIRLKFILNIV